ncbi:MAG TPA: S8 family serine peptidase [Flavobacterium sp.]|nr:S8 family serine peptidase [Flavobacterium sp.]
MKKKYTLALLALIPFLGMAQTVKQRQEIVSHYDLEALRQMKEQFESDFYQNYNKALELARINGWPLRIEKPDGGFSELQGVTEDGRPLYYTTDNLGVINTSRANHLHPGGSLGLSLTGLDMFAGVWDGDHPRVTHNDFGDRTFEFDNDPTQGFHATHVTGTIISSGASSATGKGVAYQATAWVCDWTNDVAEMTSTASQGMLLSNHSYGLDAGSGNNFPESYFGAYISASKQLDDLMYAAPFYQVVVSAGNDRSQPQTINPDKSGHDLITKWATAKNSIVVAAINNITNYTSPTQAVMSSFSSWGPTDDNRVKPDISTKGVNVNSTSNTSDTAYAQSSGTSMASPGVTGALLLLQQHYSNLNAGTFMRAATLRGLMIHTASEAGEYEGPDSRFGWGVIDARNAAKAITAATQQKALISELTLNQGATYTKTVTVDGTGSLVATICWTDKGGVVNNSVVDLVNPPLVNDLDIRITQDATTYFPWRLNDIVDDPSVQEDNSVDNVEKIEVKNPSGTYTITVTHKDNLVTGSQKFSLVVTGIDLTLGVEQDVFAKFDLWPNPVADELNVAVTDLGEDLSVAIFDLQGKRLVSQTFESAAGKARVDVSGLSSGIYFIKVLQGSKEAVRKFVKK